MSSFQHGVGVEGPRSATGRWGFLVQCPQPAGAKKVSRELVLAGGAPGGSCAIWAGKSPNCRKKRIAPGLASGALLENRVAVQVAAATVGLEIIDQFKAGGGDQLFKLRVVAVVAIAGGAGAGSKREQEIAGL